MMPVPDMDKRYELNPDLFRPDEAVDADTREFNEQLARKLAELPPAWHSRPSGLSSRHWHPIVRFSRSKPVRSSARPEPVDMRLLEASPIPDSRLARSPL
jgi:hypothetical protein